MEKIVLARVAGGHRRREELAPARWCCYRFLILIEEAIVARVVKQVVDGNSAFRSITESGKKRGEKQ